MKLKNIFLKSFVFLLSNIVSSQNYIFKANCKMGGEVHTEKIDTLKYELGKELEFIQKESQNFQPSYFNYVKLYKKSKKPVGRKLLDGYLIEYYDTNHKLVKYTFYEKHGQAFSVEILYSETGQPNKLIEFFTVQHHSQNGVFTIKYDIDYNDRNELIQIRMEDENGHLCQLKRL